MTIDYNQWMQTFVFGDYHYQIGNNCTVCRRLLLIVLYSICEFICHGLYEKIIDLAF